MKKVVVRGSSSMQDNRLEKYCSPTNKFLQTKEGEGALIAVGMLTLAGGAVGVYKGFQWAKPEFQNVIDWCGNKLAKTPDALKWGWSCVRHPHDTVYGFLVRGQNIFDICVKYTLALPQGLCNFVSEIDPTPFSPIAARFGKWTWSLVPSRSNFTCMADIPPTYVIASTMIIAEATTSSKVKGRLLAIIVRSILLSMLLTSPFSKHFSGREVSLLSAAVWGALSGTTLALLCELRTRTRGGDPLQYEFATTTAIAVTVSYLFYLAKKLFLENKGFVIRSCVAATLGAAAYALADLPSLNEKVVSKLDTIEDNWYRWAAKTIVTALLPMLAAASLTRLITKKLPHHRTVGISGPIGCALATLATFAFIRHLEDRIEENTQDWKDRAIIYFGLGFAYLAVAFTGAMVLSLLGKGWKGLQEAKSPVLHHAVPVALTTAASYWAAKSVAQRCNLEDSHATVLSGLFAFALGAILPPALLSRRPISLESSVGYSALGLAVLALAKHIPRKQSQQPHEELF